MGTAELIELGRLKMLITYYFILLSLRGLFFTITKNMV